MLNGTTYRRGALELTLLLLLLLSLLASTVREKKQGCGNGPWLSEGTCSGGDLRTIKCGVKAANFKNHEMWDCTAFPGTCF
jgi:hypothetical protein